MSLLIYHPGITVSFLNSKFVELENWKVSIIEVYLNESQVLNTLINTHIVQIF